MCLEVRIRPAFQDSLQSRSSLRLSNRIQNFFDWHRCALLQTLDLHSITDALHSATDFGPELYLASNRPLHRQAGEAGFHHEFVGKLDRLAHVSSW